MSVFTPWAPSMAPRLWLFDALYYAWFALLAWALVEAAIAWRGWRERGERALAWSIALLAIAGGAWGYERTDAGLLAKVLLSDTALRRSATLPYATPRHRAGHLLIDSVRQPVAREAWLWLGRPYGGGTGTSRALVLADAPAGPRAEGAYTFRRVTGDWWLAQMRQPRSD
jgi:hypothetical protein